MKINTSAQFKRSFTLLECLVAIYVLTFGLVSAMSLSSQSLGITSRFKNELIASNLAQEGIELIRNKRDSNFLARKKSGACAGGACNTNDKNMNGITDGGVSKCDTTGPGGRPRGCYVNWKNAVDVEAELLDFNLCSPLGGAPFESDCRPLIKNSSAGGSVYGLYVHQQGAIIPLGWELSGFDRRIYVDDATPISVRGDKRARAFVTWQDKFSGRRYIILETYLTPHLL